jgi:mRNA interferase MazF
MTSPTTVADEPDEWGDLASFREAAARDAVIPRHRRALVAPCTTTIRGLVSEVGLEPGEDPVPRPCVVNMDSVESVSVAVRVERLGRPADTRLRQICGALTAAVDCAN